MSDHDILSDAEREALSAVMLEPDLPPQRVLIVDDDKDARELLSEILALDGIRCMTAASGETALKMLEEKPSIGLVITDLRMGHVGGLELIRQVRESVRAAMPIIIVSGDADVKDAIAAMHEPARPALLLFPRFGYPRAVRRVDEAESFVRLTQASTNYVALGERGFDALTGLVRSVRACAIDYADGEEGAELVERLWSEQGAKAGARAAA